MAALEIGLMCTWFDNSVESDESNLRSLNKSLDKNIHIYLKKFTDEVTGEKERRRLKELAMKKEEEDGGGGKGKKAGGKKKK